MHRKNDEYECAEGYAKMLIKAGHAEAVKPVEPKKEKADPDVKKRKTKVDPEVGNEKNKTEQTQKHTIKTEEKHASEIFK